MNEEKKKEFKERFRLSDEQSYSSLYIDEYFLPDIWSWIDSELKQARIDENRYWVEQNQIEVPQELAHNKEKIESIKKGYIGLFNERIKELEK